MLVNLVIKNFLLIEKLNIEFKNGLCVLTGETGAGKSILLDSLIFVLGARASSKFVRQGATHGIVTAVFNIDNNYLVRNMLLEHGIELEENVILKRAIEQDGKGKTFINDTPVSLSFLKQIGENLIEFHGQHEQKGLLDASNYLNILDSYAGLNEQVNELKELFSIWREYERSLNELQHSIHNIAQEEDYLRYIIKELKDLNPVIGEEQELAEKRAMLVNKEKFTSVMKTALDELTSNYDIPKAIVSAQRTLTRNTNNYLDLTQVVDYLEKANIELNEAIALLEQKTKDITNEEINLDEIETRLFALRAAGRKFNCPVDELPEQLVKLEERLKSITNKKENILELRSKITAAKKSYLEKAEILSTERKKAALKLEESITNELKPLKMDRTVFKVVIEQLADNQYLASGFDKVIFLISANPGSPPAPLAKIASGGELSRFMLATKVVLSSINSVTTIIFDEVDTGIGGATADAVGKRLALLSKKTQIIIVTHQPQVAAKADYHLLVRKEQRNNATYTIIEPIYEEARKEEIARMLSGEIITTEARLAAESLLVNA